MIFIKSLIKSIRLYVAIRCLKKNKYQYKIIAGKKVLDRKQTNALIYDYIVSGQAFMASRYGGCENDILASYYINRKVGMAVSKLKFSYLCTNAGFFPNDINLLKKFVEVMENAAVEANLLGAWNWFMEDYIIGTFARDAQITTLGNLEPWYDDKPLECRLKRQKGFGGSSISRVY